MSPSELLGDHLQSESVKARPILHPQCRCQLLRSQPLASGEPSVPGRGAGQKAGAGVTIPVSPVRAAAKRSPGYRAHDLHRRVDAYVVFENHDQVTCVGEWVGSGLNSRADWVADENGACGSVYSPLNRKDLMRWVANDSLASSCNGNRKKINASQLKRNG